MRKSYPVKWLKTTLLRAIAVGLILGAGQYVFNADSRKQYTYLRTEVDRMQSLNSELTGQNDRLRLQIHGIENDDRYVEQIAREEFGMIRKGETVYQFNAPNL